MPVITEDLDIPGGTGLKCQVIVTLVGAGGAPAVGYTADGRAVVGRNVVVPPEPPGLSTWQLDLVANSALIPAGTAYRRVIQTAQGVVADDYFTVPAAGGPYLLKDRLATPPASIASPALDLHAADLALHGGGIELDYEVRTTNLTISATGTALTEIARVTIPLVARPIYLEAEVNAAASSGTANLLFCLTASGTATTLGSLDAGTAIGVPTAAVEANGRKVRLSARLAPSTPAGDYILGGNLLAGTATVLATSLLPTKLWAIRA
jgi:hypothetical protein